MLEKKFVAAVVLCAVLVAGPVQGQDTPKKGGSVPITFVPPPMENATYSVGIYDAKTGKLARRLCEAAGQNTFKIGLNGLNTSWDGKDDDGKPLPPGKYAARGYAVGPLKVEGEAIHGNDWTQDDEALRVTAVEAIALVPGDDGLIVLADLADNKHILLRYSGKDGSLVWKKPVDWGANRKNSGTVNFYVVSVDDTNVSASEDDNVRVVRLSDGGDVATQHVHREHKPGMNAFAPSIGKNGTIWLPVPAPEGGGLAQLKAGAFVDGKLPMGEELEKVLIRRLPVKTDDPAPWAVVASTTHDKLYVAEGGNWQMRVRGLSWVETKEEDGKQVSTWQTFFQRGIYPPDAALGLVSANGADMNPSVVDVPLAQNPLSPQKAEHLKLTATFDSKGSYLATADGLRLRQISQRPYLRAVKLVKGKEADTLDLFQSDQAAWDEFSIKGAQEIATFDAGEFEIDAAGEKPVVEKASEPDL